MDGKEFIRYEERSGGHIVQITCNDAAFDIMVNVLAPRAASEPFKALLDREKPALDIDLDVPWKGFEIFANWLKDGRVPWGVDTSVVAVQDLCSAYQIGKQFEVSPHFLDEVMDSIVHAVVQTCVREDHQKHRGGQDTGAIIKQLRTTFEQDSVGRRFFVDWLVYGDLTEVAGRNDLGRTPGKRSREGS
ncbi:hypothetical protein LTR17_015136 [Elasticomyces elasticus]|nr:hypothetical protein LTR17_015136 [Elasticomyces elasticus]